MPAKLVRTKDMWYAVNAVTITFKNKLSFAGKKNKKITNLK